VFAICVGCWIFGRLMRLGVIPDSACDACNDVTALIGIAQPRSGTLAG
jgi:hypothetical protein